MDINRDTVYWLLSTTAQVYAALIAIFGALAVFRWQISSQFRRDLRQNVVETLSFFSERIPSDIGRDPNSVPTDGLEDFWEKEFSKDFRLQMQRDYPRKHWSLMDHFKDLRASKSHRKSLFGSTTILTAVFLVFVAASLLGLFWTRWLEQSQCWLLGLTVVALIATFILAFVHFRIVFIESGAKKGGNAA